MATAAPTTQDAQRRAQQAAHDEDVDQYRWWILLGLITAAVMEVLDTTIINVALPQMAGNLGATTQEIGWVATGYILSNVVVLPMTAFFTSMFGRRNYLSASIVIFVVASFLCGTSHSLGELVLWRVVQGAGGAALLSTAQATLRQIFPREQQGMVQAIFILGIIVAPTLGPTLGGWITDNYNWNWCFFINIPIGALSVFLVSGFLHDPPGMQRKPEQIDFLGISLLIVGLASLQYVLEEGRSKDWFSDVVIVRLSIAAVICLGTMVWWELSPRNEHPVVNFRVLHNRDLAGSIFLFVALGFGLYGGVFLFPLFTQNLLRFTPTETGLTLMPGGIATGAMAIVCGRLLNGKRPLADPRLLIYLGVALFVVSMWQLGHLTTAAGEADARLPLIVRGLGLGFLFTPINNAAGVGTDQFVAPVGWIVRHRAAHDVSRPSDRGASGGPCRDDLCGEPPVRSASRASDGGIDGARLQRNPGASGVAGGDQSVDHAAGQHVELQRRMDVHPGDIRAGFAGNLDSA
jgi:MFS transporter, DHA2 family, multidrug resistance protein